MKIISKNWDFYDSMSTGDDQVPVYVRKPRGISRQSEEYKKCEKALSKFYKYIGRSWNPYSYHRDKNEIVWGVVGIFPKVYLVPVFKWVEYTPEYWSTDKFLPLSFEEYWSEDLFTKATGKTFKVFDAFRAPYRQDRKLKYRVTTDFNSRITEADDTWIIEDQDIFYELGAPVFVWSPTGDLIGFKKSAGEQHDYSHLCLNLTFSELSIPLLKYITLEPFDVYTRIENFLWSVRVQEPSEPSNTTKILSAGFDLKTSFRNVK